jgi:hypothetical protein
MVGGKLVASLFVLALVFAQGDRPCGRRVAPCPAGTACKFPPECTNPWICVGRCVMRPFVGDESPADIWRVSISLDNPCSRNLQTGLDGAWNKGECRVIKVAYRSIRKAVQTLGNPLSWTSDLLAAGCVRDVISPSLEESIPIQLPVNVT